MSTATAPEIEGAVEAEGFVTLGWFHVAAGDGVPDLASGSAAGTLLLIGNACPAMWRRFTAERGDGNRTLDSWSGEVLGRLADALGAAAHFPYAKPHLPFQRWAARAGIVHTSPLGMSIHAEYGLWHAYRGALAFAETIILPAGAPTISPCDTCADRPCLSSCPVGAFSGAAYDVPACAAHLASHHGTDCMELGCRARRACPVGRAFIYEPAQALFHMSAFLRARSQND